jgi:hypothetical protein
MTREPKRPGGMEVFFDVIDIENLRGIDGELLQHPLEDQRVGLEGTELVREKMVRNELKDAQVSTTDFVMERIRIAQQTDASTQRDGRDLPSPPRASRLPSASRAGIARA